MSKFGSAMTFGQFYENKALFSALKEIKGSSLTIPGQARDLGALLAAAKYSGGMVPRHGTPGYDDTFEEGYARMTFESMDEDQISQLASDAVKLAEKKEDVKDDADDKSDDGEAGEQ